MIGSPRAPSYCGSFQWRFARVPCLFFHPLSLFDVSRLLHLRVSGRGFLLLDYVSLAIIYLSESRGALSTVQKSKLMKSDCQSSLIVRNPENLWSPTAHSFNRRPPITRPQSIGGDGGVGGQAEIDRAIDQTMICDPDQLGSHSIGFLILF